MARCELGLPPGFALGEATVGDDRHAAGRAAARQALERLGSRGELAYDGPRPIIVDDDVKISITHGKRRALAVAARVRYLGIDLADDDPRLPALAERYFASEHVFARTGRELAACLAGKEAGLKALGLGLLDGGMFDNSVVRVVSLAPPRLACEIAALELIVRIVPEGAVAIAYSLA